MLHGLSSTHAERIAEARGKRPFGSLEDFARRTGLGRSVAVRLAKAGAFESLGLDRRQALWHALGQDQKSLPLFEQKGPGFGEQGSGFGEKGSGFSVQGSENQSGVHEIHQDRMTAAHQPCEPLPSDPEMLNPETRTLNPRSSTSLQPDANDSLRTPHPTVNLPKMSPAEEVLADYRTTGLSLKAHPLQFLREHLDRLGVAPAEQLGTLPKGGPVRVAGIVLVRQRPGTAKGITFVTLEDETGTANLIIRPDVWKRYRTAALGATVLLAHGRLQRQGLVIHVLVTKLENLSGRLKNLESQSRDFC